MIEQLYSPEGLSLYCRKDGSILRLGDESPDILLCLYGMHGRINYRDRLRTDPWRNDDNRLWCHLAPPQLVIWRDEE